MEKYDAEGFPIVANWETMTQLKPAAPRLQFVEVTHFVKFLPELNFVLRWMLIVLFGLEAEGLLEI